MSSALGVPLRRGALWAVVLVTACTTAPELRATGAAGSAGEQTQASGRPSEGFVLRQRIDFAAGEQTGSFEAVVQLCGTELTVIGLAPFGARAFTLRDRPDGPEVETHLPFEWPFPPEYILRDVRRTFLVPVPAAPPPDGTRSFTWRDGAVEETWRDGRLLERRFEEGTPSSPAIARLELPGGPRPGELPSQVALTSERYGYRLAVTTLSRTKVRCTR